MSLILGNDACEEFLEALNEELSEVCYKNILAFEVKRNTLCLTQFPNRF